MAQTIAGRRDIMKGGSMRIAKTMLHALVPIAWLAASPVQAGAPMMDETPRTAIMSAFAPEWASLEHMVDDAQRVDVNGVAIVSGTMAGKPVLLMESGVSMVNAAMNAQMLIDRFTVKRIVFSGIAGGADPTLSVGDVSVPDHWAQNLEVVMARQTAGGFAPATHGGANGMPAFGMMYPRDVRVSSATGSSVARSFEAEPGLLAIARTIAPMVTLAHCATAGPAPVEDRAPGKKARRTGAKAADESGACLPHQPRIVVGGAGVSSPAFVDNAAYREYLHSNYGARVIDMESAAVAQVAHTNGLPFIAFRSLSDLAGGDAGENSMHIFMTLAAANSATVVRTFVAALPD